MRPLIGITTDLAQNPAGQPLSQLSEQYSRAIADSGAVPVLIPAALDGAGRMDLFTHLDGILFSGGGDIEPRHYGGAANSRLAGVHPSRDELELDLLRLAVEARKPFLGICRGCQVVNVGLGGTLFPDLPTDPGGPIRHDLPGSERNVLAHEVMIEAGTQLAAILGQPIVGVNSHHHQGLNVIAAGLRIAGRAPDGLVEAVELPHHPFALAVQWHPEWLTHQIWTRSLFVSLVEAANRP